MRKLIAFLALASMCFAQPAYSQYMVNFREADIRAVVQDVARVTGLTFIVDERVRSKISVVSDRPLSRSEYFEVFLNTLRANGLVAVPMARGGYRIQPAAGAASQPTRVGGSSRAPASQLVTEVFRLRHIRAAQAVETLRPLISTNGSLTANTGANSIVVADFADNVRRISALVQQIDRDTSSSEIVQIENAGAREIAAALQTLAGSGDNAAVAVAAVDSSNAIAIRGDQQQVSRFVAMARRLDAQADTQAEIKVYWLEYADAEQLLPAVQQILGQPASPVSSGPEFLNRPSTGLSGDQQQGAAELTTQSATSGSNLQQVGGTNSQNGIAQRGPAVVTRFAGGNALIVAARPDIQKQLGELIRQLDTPRPQVLVEAIVAELSNDAARRLGVQFLLGGKDAPILATSYSNAKPNILTIGGAYAATALQEQTTVIDGNVVTTSQSSPLGNTLQQAAISDILGASGGFAGALFEIGSGALFGAILNAVQSDTEANLLSSPSIMVIDNQSARMLVGQEVPITTGEALSDNFDNAFRTVDRQNVGVQLEVKPQVNSSGQIKLYVRQEVSSIAGPVSTRNDDLVLNKREFQTALYVEDGQMIAIGGLIDENERRTIEKIPFLGDLPIIGNLFKSKSRSREKTNLVVFLRPTIIQTRADADALTARRYGYFRAGQLLANNEVEPTLDTLLRDYMGVMPPAEALRIGDQIYFANRPPQEVENDGDIVDIEVPASTAETVPPAEEVQP